MLYSAKELAHFERIRNQFEQQDVTSKAKGTMSNNGRPGLTTWSLLPTRQHNSPQATQGTAATTGNTMAAKGKGKGKAIANPDSGPDDSGNSGDDYSNNTRIANGAMNGHRGEGSDKGKSPLAEGFVETEEENLCT